MQQRIPGLNDILKCDHQQQVYYVTSFLVSQDKGDPLWGTALGRAAIYGAEIEKLIGVILKYCTYWLYSFSLSDNKIQTMRKKHNQRGSKDCKWSSGKFTSSDVPAWMSYSRGFIGLIRYRHS